MIAHLKKHLWLYTILAIILFFAGMYVTTYGWPNLGEIKAGLTGDISHTTVPHDLAK
ncbi:hypothetical protein JW752_00990 [Candidatus Peregrinibacteria bacterium]|nr:hypothetical protein [Candidatus Peregrinibacteria bacterium]